MAHALCRLPGPDTLGSRNGSPRRRRRVDHAMSKDLQARTIADFGEQWTVYPDSEGFFGSAQLFDDFFSPLVVGRRRRRAPCRRDRRRHRAVRQRLRRGRRGAHRRRGAVRRVSRSAGEDAPVRGSDHLSERRRAISCRRPAISTTSSPSACCTTFPIRIRLLPRRSARCAAADTRRLALWPRRQYAVSSARAVVVVADAPPAAPRPRAVRPPAVSALLVLHDRVPPAAAPARRLHAPCHAAAYARQAPCRHLRSAQSRRTRSTTRARRRTPCSPGTDSRTSGCTIGTASAGPWWGRRHEIVTGRRRQRRRADVQRGRDARRNFVGAWSRRRADSSRATIRVRARGRWEHRRDA